MELRNPFGLRGGQIVMIEDIPKSMNGLRCNCLCPACNEPFEARIGDIRRHHFAHSGQGCDEINAYMSGLYMLLNEYLNSDQPLYLPPLIVSYQLPQNFYLTEKNIVNYVNLLSISQNTNNEIELYKEREITFEAAEIEKNITGKPQAIIAKREKRELALCITPPSTVCRIGKATKYKNYSTMEIDLSSLGELIEKSSKAELFSYLSEKTDICHWIYNPKVSEAYPEIIELSKQHYEEVQKRKKQQEEAFQKMKSECLTVQKKNIKFKHLVKCEICGKIDYDKEFGDYTALKSEPYTGKCYECYRKEKNT